MRDFIPDILMTGIEVLTIGVPFGTESTLGENAEIMQVEEALVRSAEANAIFGAVYLKAVALKDGRIRNAKEMVEDLLASGDEEDPCRKHMRNRNVN